MVAMIHIPLLGQVRGISRPVQELGIGRKYTLVWGMILLLLLEMALIECVLKEVMSVMMFLFGMGHL